MIDIQKLAKLTGLHLTPQEEEKFWPQLESAVHLLEKVKNFQTTEGSEDRYSLLDLHTTPNNTLTPDSDPQRLLANIAHPLIGQAVEVSKFVE